MIVVGGFQLCYGYDLKCDLYIAVDGNMGETYFCEDSTIENAKDDVVITGYSGEHERGLKDIDVKVLLILDTQLKYIPEKIGSIFHLTALYLVETKLTKIRANDFIGLEDLEYLDFSKNKLNNLQIDTFAKLSKLKKIKFNENSLTELQNDLFNHNVQIENLDFEGNNIKFIGRTLFDKLTKLVSITFTHNECLKFTYENDDIALLKQDIEDSCINKDDEKFSELRKEIAKLKTDNGNLEREIKTKSFKSNINVVMNCVYEIKDKEYICKTRDLTIERNGVTIDLIDGTHLNSHSIADVTDLIITKSKIEYLPKNMFNNFTGLDALKITKVKLSELSKGDFNGATKLKDLRLTENNINELEEFTFEGAEQLTTIVMDANNIEKVSKSTFNGLKLLNVLSLKDNIIKELHVETFKELVNLKKLTISRNKLKILDGKLFEFNVNLDWLSLDQNQLRVIGEDILKYAKDLHYVNLYENSCIGESSKEYDRNQLTFVIKHCCKNHDDASKIYTCGNEGW